MSDPDELVTLARADGRSGEVVLRRRTAGGVAVDELIVDGAFAMDSSEVSTEQALARVVLRPAGPVPVGPVSVGPVPVGRVPVGRVLVGGLGLGFTTLELLRAGAERVDVVELEPCLLDWARAGLTASLAEVAADPRAHLTVGDVAEVLLGRAAAFEEETRWDAILLDVDNGPDFLIHDGNARLYEAPLLAAAADRLAPGGTLAIWCQGPAPALAATLAGLRGRTGEQLIGVTRGTRELTYAIYTLTR